MNPNRLATVIAATVGWNQTRKKIAYYGSGTKNKLKMM
jgi:hypothetical protein